jgi:precorrin-2 dehydrogenase / sirohydrochlorin ferrochelatase
MERNHLYPVFLKLHELHLLIVGAGEVGHEKLSFILKSSPLAKVTMVAPEVHPEIIELLEQSPGHRVSLVRKKFEPSDLQDCDLVITATNIRELNQAVQVAAKERGLLINVADTPALCDFYLGSIVTRGSLKVGISTDGKSPTFAKRFREVMEEALPPELEDLLPRLNEIRDRLGGDFANKVRLLNRVTAVLLEGMKDCDCAGQCSGKCMDGLLK